MTHEHDRGLAYDLPRLMSRRRALTLLTGGAASAVLAACGSSRKEAAPSSGTAEIPDETAGPFPGDGSNGPNVLTESGVVRRDITSSFGGASGVADGVPAALEMTLLDVATDGKPLTSAAVYVWHCDKEGRYSIYDQAIAGENYLRGVQVSDADGKVKFASIFPAAYSGRWPHIHFEVYKSLEAAGSAGARLKTSQLALPKATCDLVYATRGYEQSAQQLTQMSLDSDMVFSDGYASQLAKTSGSVENGIDIKLDVGV